MNRRVDWTRVRTIAFGVLAGVVASAGTLAVTVAGFALSYDAIRAVGIASRIRAELAWLLPVSVDGAMAVATIAAVVLRRMTGRTAWYPWAVVLVGAGISVACNGLHALPSAGAHLVIADGRVRFAVSAIPAVMLALSVHLLVTLVEAASVAGAGGPSVRPSIGSSTTVDDRPRRVPPATLDRIWADLEGARLPDGAAVPSVLPTGTPSAPVADAGDDLLDGARTAAADLARRGVSVSRDNLARAMREAGATVSNERASALVRQLRTDRPARVSR